MGNRIHQEQILASDRMLLGNRLLVIPTSDVTKGDILALTTFDNKIKVAPFDPTSHGKEVRLIASRDQAADGRAHDCGLTDLIVLTGVDTSGAAAAGAPVYANTATAGGWTTTNPGAAGIVVGMVLVKDATAGIVVLTTSPDVTTFLLATLASTANAKGASLIGIEDAGTLITATTVEGALAENRTAIDAVDPLFDQLAYATCSLADVSGVNDAALSVQLKRAHDASNVASARQFLLHLTVNPYEAYGPAHGTLSLGTVTAGAIIATIQGGAQYLIQTDATGAFACTATNTADETIYVKALTATSVSDIAERCSIVGSNDEDGTWSP